MPTATPTPTSTSSSASSESPPATASATKYAKLAAQVRADIRSGKFAPGEAVPSIRKLMSTKNLSKATVMRGLAVLEEDGLVTRHPQRGYFVSERRRMSGGRDSTRLGQIAFITPALTGDTEPYAKGITSAIDPDRYALATFSTHGDLDAYGRLINRVIELQPTGLVLATIRPSLMQFDPARLLDSDIPVVTIGHHLRGLSCDRVSEGKAAAARHLVEYLLKRGYAKQADDVGLICCGRDELTPDDSMAWSVLKELERAGLPLDPRNIHTLPGLRGYGSHPDPYGEADDLVGELLRRGRQYRVLICDHDYPAIGALRALVRAGLKVPDDVAVISGLRCATRDPSLPTLTTFDHHRDMEGRLATELLMKRIDGDDRPPEVHYLPSTLSIGESA